MKDNPNYPTDRAADYLQVSARTLNRWRNMRKGPAWIKAGRKVLYRRSDLDAWLDHHRVEPVREGAR
ncbi:MAG: helix-turn-helix domain-containing protein [Pseudomonadota bacterium]